MRYGIDVAALLVLVDPDPSDAVFLSGSLAHGQNNHLSDIDVLVVAGSMKKYRKRPMAQPTDDGLQGIQMTICHANLPRVELKAYAASRLKRLARQVESYFVPDVLQIRGTAPVTALSQHVADEDAALILLRTLSAIPLNATARRLCFIKVLAPSIFAWRAYVLAERAASNLLDAEGMLEDGELGPALMRVQDAATFAMWSLLVAQHWPIDRSKWILVAARNHGLSPEIINCFVRLRFPPATDLSRADGVREAIANVWDLLDRATHNHGER